MEMRPIGRSFSSCILFKPVLGLQTSAWIGYALFFHAREAVSATTGSAVTWRGNVQRGMLILAATLAAFLGTGDVSDDAEIRGRVVKVADGDTLTVLAAAGRAGSMNPPPPATTQHKIRLNGIDAPESHQAFGNVSKKHLSSLVFGKDVRVKYKSRDKYGRILGTVYVDGLDINLEMIRAGLAWHYKRFDSTLAYAAAELEARQSRRGLWSDPNPTPPEQFRHTSSNKRHNRNCENYRKRGAILAASPKGHLVLSAEGKGHVGQTHSRALAG